MFVRCSNKLVAYEDVVVVHTGCDGADDNARAVVGSMDHLAVTDVDAGVIRVNYDVAGLWIRHTSPAHKVTSGTQTAVTTREAVAHKAGAVEAVRSNTAPGISATKLAVGTRNNGAAVNGLARRRRGRSRSGSGLRRRSRSGRGCRRVAASIVGVLGRTGSLVAHRGLLGGTGVDAGLQRGVGLGLGGKLSLQLRIQRVYDVLGFSLLGVKLIDLLLRGGDVLLLLGLRDKYR